MTIYDTVRKILSQSGDAAVDMAGSASLGPAWPLFKPVVTAMKGLFGPSPADEAMAEALKRWADEQQRAHERAELVRLIVDAQQREVDPLLVRVARILAASESEERARHSALRASAFLALDLGLATAAHLDNLDSDMDAVKRNLVLLGFSDFLVNVVAGALRRPPSKEHADRVLLDLRTALSVQVHPLARVLFELGLGAGRPNQAGFFDAARSVAREQGLDGLLIHAFENLEGLQQGQSRDEITTQLRTFCDTLLQFF
jgi:hypothetical protein